MNQFRTNKVRQPIWPKADISMIIYVIESLLPKTYNKLVTMLSNVDMNSEKDEDSTGLGLIITKRFQIIIKMKIPNLVYSQKENAVLAK